MTHKVQLQMVYPVLNLQFENGEHTLDYEIPFSSDPRLAEQERRLATKVATALAICDSYDNWCTGRWGHPEKAHRGLLSRGDIEKFMEFTGPLGKQGSNRINSIRMRVVAESVDLTGLLGMEPYVPPVQLHQRLSKCN